MATIAVEMTGDEAKLWKAQQKILRQQMQMDAGYKRMQQAAKKGAAEQAGAFNRAAGSLQRMVGGYVTLQGAVSLFNRALEEQNQLAKEAATTQTTLARAQQETIKNLTGLTSEQKKVVFAKDVTRIQALTGFRDASALTAAVGAGFSASGDLEATKSAVQAAAPLTLLTPESVGDVSAGALDVARGSGIKDARRNLGFLLTAGAINRIEDPTALARSLAPVVSSGVATVPTQAPEEAAREIGAVFGTLAKLATDVKGLSTGTAATQLLSKMDKFFSEREDPGTIFGRIKALQEDPNLRQALLGKEGFGEERFKKALELIMTAGTPEAEMLAAGKEQVKFDPQVYADTVREINTLTPQLQLAIANAKSDARIQLLELDEELGREATAREILANTLRKTRLGPVGFADDWRLLFKYDVGGPGSAFGGEAPEARAIRQLEERRYELLNQTYGIFGRPRDPDSLPTKDRTLLETLNIQIGLLRELLQESRRQTSQQTAARRAADTHHRAAAIAERHAQRE